MSPSRSLFFLRQSGCPNPFVCLSSWCFSLNISQAQHRRKHGAGEDTEVMMGFICCFSLALQKQFTIILWPIAEGRYDARSYLSKGNSLKSTKASWASCFQWTVQIPLVYRESEPAKTAPQSENRPPKTFCKSYFSGSKAPKSQKSNSPSHLSASYFRIKGLSENSIIFSGWVQNAELIKHKTSWACRASTVNISKQHSCNSWESSERFTQRRMTSRETLSSTLL